MKMKVQMKIMAVLSAAIFAVAGAFASGVNKVEPVNAEWNEDANAYIATPEYMAAPNTSSAPFRSVEGWYAGIKLTWVNNRKNAKEISASVSDKPHSHNEVTEYTVCNSNGSNNTPLDSGMTNTITSSGLFTKTYYMSKTEWYVCITPELLYALGGEDYTATLVIGDNTYTITVPNNIVLSDGTHQWYPAVGLLGDKVYGDAQYLADLISSANYTTAKFLTNPEGLTFDEGFAPSSNGDGTWGVVMTHSHSWNYDVSADGATLTATCDNAGCPIEGSHTTLSLVLSEGDKVYNAVAITPSAVPDDNFNAAFPNAVSQISVTKGGNAVETIKDAGEYVVKMTVSGLGDEQEHLLSRTVTIDQVDITDAQLVLEPASVTYKAAEYTVEPSVTVNNLVATFDVDESASTLTATEIGTYTVTVHGKDNFKGTATASWEIVNTTGSLSSVAPTVAGIGDYNNESNTLTITDSTKLEYSDGAWFAGITLKWPMTRNNGGLAGGGYAQYVDPSQMQLTIGETVYRGNALIDAPVEISYHTLIATTNSSSYKTSSFASETKFNYLDTTTWKVCITPAIIEAALADEKTELVYTMNAGAFAWGTSTQGDTDGVEFQDYTITIPLDENLRLYDEYENQVYPALPYVAQIDGGKKYLSLAEALTASESGQTVALVVQDGFEGEYVIPEGVTIELGSFGSANATYVLSVDSKLTSDVDIESKVSTCEVGYGVQKSGEGPYEYNTVVVHTHNWHFSVSESGYELTASCTADNCILDPTTYSMWLFTGAKSGATEDVNSKVYDGESMSRKAEYDEGFTNIFPNVTTAISVTKGGNAVETIKDAGEYVVEMTVSGLGDEQEHLLSRTVTIDQVDITDAQLVLEPASVTYDAAEHTAEPSVTVNNLSATFEVDEGVSTLTASKIGTYPVTVNGTGNFKGTATASWEIVNTTGSLSSVAPTVAGIGDYNNESNTLTINDSTKLEYSDGAWFAGITLEWPVDAVNASISPLRNGHAYYVSTNAMYLTIGECTYTGSDLLESQNKIEYPDGVLEAVNTNGTYWYLSGLSLKDREFTAMDTTSWKVRLTPAIIEAALADEKTELVYKMNAGSFVWGDEPECDADGVAFEDYTITIPLNAPVVFALGEGESYDLGETVLTTTKIRLDVGASVTSASVQTEGSIVPSSDEYELACRNVDGGYEYLCRIKAIVDDEDAVAGYMEGTTAVLTNTVNAVSLPESATAVEIVLSGDSATVRKAGTQLETVKVYASDENGNRQETEITGAFSVTVSEGVYAVALDPEKATPEIEVSDFSNAGSGEDNIGFTVSAFKGLWYGISSSGDLAEAFQVNAGSVKQATGEGGTVDLEVPSSEADAMFYRIKVAPSKAALMQN